MFHFIRKLYYPTEYIIYNYRYFDILYIYIFWLIIGPLSIYVSILYIIEVLYTYIDETTLPLL